MSTEAPPFVSVLDDLIIPNQPAKSELAPRETTKEEPEKTPKEQEAKPVEPPKEQEKRVAKAPGNQENFKTVLASKEAAEKKASELETQLSERQKKIEEMEARLAELPQKEEAAQKLQAQIQEREQALAKLAEDYARTKEEAKAANLQRDPEFIEKFDKPREFQVNQLKAIAGVNEGDVLRALKDRNYERLTEFRDQLPEYQKVRLDVVLRKIEEIDLAKEQELQDADKAWEKLQETRRQQAMRSHAERLDNHRSIAAKIINQMREKVDFFREDKELQQQVGDIAEAVAGGKGAENWTPEALIGTTIAVPILQRVNAMQAKLIEENKAKMEENAKQLAELQKKLEEQDKYIQGRYGAIDFTAPAAKDSNGDYDPNRPIHEQIAVRRN